MLPGRCLHDVVAAWANQTPDRVAVTCSGTQLTYGELLRRADDLAARLAARGVRPGVLVGLAVDRSPEAIVGLLGILRAGGGYVPMDPDYPAQRLEFLVADSGVPLVVSVTRVADRLAGCAVPVLHLDQPAGDDVRADVLPEASENDVAYVIYTSGSTGVPKGVLVEHRNVRRLFTETEPQFGCTADDVWSVFHSISFDFSVWEIWGALLYGGRLVVVPSDVARTPGLFLELLEAEGVTMLSQTPSAFRQLAAEDARRDGWDSKLRQIVFGGERLDLRVVAPWIARHGDERPMLVNMYGITETTVHVTYRRIAAADVDSVGVSPIGRPIADLRIHLLDEAGRPVPDGTPGEIYVSGAGVARGYLGRPELTAERFLPEVNGTPGPVYRSGDLAVRLPDGEYAYVGRADDQIKVRGYRVEPGEVETFLAADPRVEAAIVTARDFGDGDVRLLAYLLPASGAAGAEWTADLAARATEALPSHLRPSAYHVVSHVPLTPHGKVDRAALDSVTIDLTEPVGEPAAALAGTESGVLAICEEVLERTGLPLDVDVFDLGATSLAFIRILSHVNEQFGVSILGPELGDAATVQTIAACVDALLKDADFEAIGG